MSDAKRQTCFFSAFLLYHIFLRRTSLVFAEAKAYNFTERGDYMLLYHGSRTGGIEVLEPRLADHDRPYIYFSTIEVVAAFYLCNAVERPYYWFPYGFSKNGVPVYDELYPNALEEVSKGVKGYIYTAEIPEEDVLPFKNIPCARLGTKPEKVLNCIEVPDAHNLLMNYAKEGKLIVGKFEDKSKKELNWYYNKIFEYISEKEMIKTPNCSYAKFVRKKFPFVWEKYESEN